MLRTTAPIAISDPPIAFPMVMDSLRTGHASRMTKTTLSLSIGATLDAGPQRKGAKIEDPGEPRRKSRKCQIHPALATDLVHLMMNSEADGYLPGE
jgi:hypothetical protein